MEENWKVYVHINKMNGKKYFGITSREPKVRWRSYRDNSPIKRAFNKYGRDNFQSEIILNNLSKEEAEDFEIYFIARYKSLVTQWGYNIELGGSSSGKLSPEQKERCFKIFSNYYKDIEHRKLVGNNTRQCWKRNYEFMYNACHSTEVKEKRIKSLLKTYESIELRNKLSDGLKIRWSNPEYRNKISELFQENEWSSCKIVCDNKEYGSISSFCKKYSLCETTVLKWLNGSNSMPEEWYNKGLMYKDKENLRYKRTDEGNFNLWVDNKHFTKIIDMANYLGILDSTLSRYINGKRKCPHYLLERGFRVEK